MTVSGVDFSGAGAFEQIFTRENLFSKGNRFTTGSDVLGLGKITSGIVLIADIDKNGRRIFVADGSLATVRMGELYGELDRSGFTAVYSQHILKGAMSDKAGDGRKWALRLDRKSVV